MVSTVTRTTAQSQREVQRLDCSVPGLLVVLAVGCPYITAAAANNYAPWGWRWYYHTGSSGPGGGRAPPWLEVQNLRQGPSHRTVGGMDAIISGGDRPVPHVSGLPHLQGADALPFKLREAQAQAATGTSQPGRCQHPRQPPTGRCTGTKDHTRASTILPRAQAGCQLDWALSLP